MNNNLEKDHLEIGTNIFSGIDCWEYGCISEVKLD